MRGTFLFAHGQRTFLDGIDLDECYDERPTKTPTGIEGLDEITNGGLPTGRTTLVCGSAGSGKTVIGMEFLVHGILDYGEPGVFMAFEETEKDLTQNVASFGYDLEQLQKDGKLAIDHVFIERSEIEETGEYDLEGLFIRLGNAVDTIKAKRVVLDTIEVLFAGLKNQSIIRAELRRLFRWLKDRGLTAIVTGERGEGMLTRYGLEEYVADCVILLDHRVTEQISTRRLRIVKYRGSLHGTDEYPFLMGETRNFGAAHYLGWPEPYGFDRTDFLGSCRPGRDVGRQRIFPRQQHSGLRHGRDGQVQFGDDFSEGGLRTGRAGAVFRF